MFNNKNYKIKCLFFQILEDTCFATSDVILLQNYNHSSTWIDLPTKTGSDGASVNLGVDVLIGDEPEKSKLDQSTPTIASARSVSLNDETPSNKDSHWPLEPDNATENNGSGLSSFATRSATHSRTVVRSELLVVGNGNDKLVFSQGVSIGSNATEKDIFEGPATLKVTETDILLQKKEKENIATEKQSDADSPTNCYKGCF